MPLRQRDVINAVCRPEKSRAGNIICWVYTTHVSCVCLARVYIPKRLCISDTSVREILVLVHEI